MLYQNAITKPPTKAEHEGGALRCVLFKDTYTFDPTHHDLTDLGSHEVSGTRQTLSNPVVVDDPETGQARFDADDPTFSGSLTDVGGLIVYRSGGSDSQRELLACLMLPTPYSGLGVTIELPTEGLFAGVLVQF